ncbi:MAG: hypothetical protein Kow0059_20690 [Candidatus Sumerlaeia bacterium]
MDGRAQLPVIHWLRRRFGVPFVDMITEAGPNRILAEAGEPDKVNAILRRVDISVERHSSKAIALAGHFDCAGNPADHGTQLEHIRRGVRLLRKRYAGLEVVGLWLDERFEVHEVAVEDSN